EETTEEHLESPAEMVELLSRNGFATTSTSFTRSTTELEEIAVSSVSQQNIQNFGNIANFDEATMMSVQRQVITATQEIMGRLTVNSSDEVNLVLNPENLGRISVRLTNQGGDIIIRIAAESEETQAILRERLPSLMQSLTEINNSVREITVEEISQSAEMQANLMFGNGSDAQAQSEQGNNYSNEAVEEISETEETDSMKGVSRLWQKA
ncbi:MAG: flagellar hook-length control protein FliK, partial [Oscillospiraceae bacterium]|nr:flagellar hook-length control protein FliK [Oscillospiraceae bacterium]